MIDLNGMISIPYLKKAVFTGSGHEMRFLLRKKSGEEKETIEAVIWPGPFIFSVTEDEKKTFQEFPFDAEGLDLAIEWLNEQYAERFQKK